MRDSLSSAGSRHTCIRTPLDTKQVDDAPAGFLGDRLPAVGAAEAVRAAFVVGTHANGQIVCGQLYVPTARAVGPDRCHRVTRPWSASESRNTAVWRLIHPSAGPRGCLRLPDCGPGHISAGSTRRVARCVAVAVITFAHRGARLVEPENTIPAFRRRARPGRLRDSRPTCGSRPTARSSARTTPSWPAGCGAGRSRRSTAEELATLGRSPLRRRLRRARDRVRVLGRREDGRRGRRRSSTSRGRTTRSERLWVCSPDVELLPGSVTSHREATRA